MIATHNAYHATFQHQTNLLSEVVITDEQDNVLDWFVSTNGLLSPIPSSELRKYATKPSDKKEDTK